MDAVTAVSGSGPAYFFLLVEMLEAAGIELGLAADECEASRSLTRWLTILSASFTKVPRRFSRLVSENAPERRRVGVPDEACDLVYRKGCRLEEVHRVRHADVLDEALRRHADARFDAPGERSRRRLRCPRELVE